MTAAGESRSGGSRKRYTGHERDETTGLDYMLARYYGANLGRFLIVDPTLVVFPHSSQSWNAYDYSRNNPTNVIDLDGELPTAVAGAIAGGVIGGGMELGKQLWKGDGVKWRDVGSAAAGGAATGAIAGATGGLGLVGKVIGGSVGAATGGVVDRGLDSDRSTVALDAKRMVVDAAAGGTGGAVAYAAGALVSASPEVARQAGKALPLLKKGAEAAGKAAGNAAGRAGSEAALGEGADEVEATYKTKTKKKEKPLSK